MFVVYMHWVTTNQKDLCVVTKTRDKALEWIKNKMDGKRYSGLGVYAVVELEVYE